MSANSSEKDFHMLAEMIPQLVWVIKPSGDFVYCNKKWFKYLNITPSQNTFEAWENALHPDDREKITQLWHHSVVTGEPYETEYRLKNGKTDEYRWFLARASAVKSDDGSEARWFGTCTDVHEQKVVTEAQAFLAGTSKILSSSLNYVETLERVVQLAVPQISDWCSVELVENNSLTQIAVAHKDPEKVKWAKKFAQNRKRDISSQRVIPKVLRSGKSEFYPNITEKMIAQATKDPNEIELIKSLGFTSVMIVPITIEKKTIGVIQFVSTESKKHFNQYDLYVAEEIGRRAALAIQNAQLYDEAQRKEKQFRALYDSNIIGVIYSDLGGQIIDTNDAFLQMIGYSKAELNSGKIRWDTLTPPQYQTASQRAAEEILKNGVVTPWEKEYIKKDGSTVPVIIGTVLLNKKTTEMLTFVLDITERKRLEERKDEFIGITSHELKTPLTSIKGYVQILERMIDELGNEKMSEYIEKTNTYINRLNSLIVDLLDVSKIQAGKLVLNVSTFDFQELALESVEEARLTSASHKILFKNEKPIQLTADKHRLQQVLTNLLTNAVKYSPRANKVVVNMAVTDQELTVGIQDFGIGISQNELSKIFDRFYRVESISKRFSGLGIGLYISYEIVQRHGGKMWAESELGKGSTFYFSIPLSPKKL